MLNVSTILKYPMLTILPTANASFIIKKRFLSVSFCHPEFISGSVFV